MEAQNSVQVNKIKTALHLDSYPRKSDGKQQFLLRVYTGNRKYIFIRTGKYMLSRYWVENKITSGKGNPDASNLKSYLGSLVSKAEIIVNDLISRGRAITKRTIEKRLFEDQGNSFNEGIGLIPYIRDVYEREQKAGNVSDSRMATVGGTIKQLKDFDPDVVLSEIDPKWFYGFQTYMTGKGLSHNTQVGYVRVVVKVINYAEINDEIFDKNPLKSFKPIRCIDGDKEYLTVEELGVVHRIYVNEEFLKKGKVMGFRGTTLQRCLKRFLIGCYTGLRFSDIVKLKRSDFYGPILRVKMQKTIRQNKTVSIPITEPLMDVLKLDQLEEGEPILGWKTQNSQWVNRLIKKIAQYAKIDKYLTFHCSRHTFACVALELGMSLEAISEILGHATLTQTKVYAKIQASRIQEEMTVFNQLSIQKEPKPTRLQKVS